MRFISQHSFFTNRRLLFISCTLIVIVGTSCNDDESNTNPVDSQRQNSGAPQVDIANPATKEIVEWDRYTGRLEAVRFVEIRSRVSGYLEAVHFSEGAAVEAGQLLFTIDRRPFEAAVKTAEARVRESRALLEQATTEVRQAESRIKQVDAQVQLASTRLARARELNTQNAISQEELEIRRNDLVSAQADQEAAQATISAAEAGVASAEAQLATAQAELETAELELSYTTLHSPIDGRASDWRVNVGNYVTGGQQAATLLTTVVSLSPVHAMFDANEQQLLKYERLDKAGTRESSRNVKNPVYLSLADEQGFPHKGHMDFVDNRIDPNTGTIRGRAIFPNENQILIPGLFAKIRIPGSAQYEAILVPDAAILSDQSEQYVYVVDDKNVVNRQTVETGPLSHGLRVIREGLEADARVVLSNLQQLREGMTVVAEPASIDVQPAAETDLPNQIQPVPESEWLSPEPETLLPDQAAVAPQTID